MSLPRGGPNGAGISKNLVDSGGIIHIPLIEIGCPLKVS